jgi:hypothetical protein
MKNRKMTQPFAKSKELQSQLASQRICSTFAFAQPHKPTINITFTTLNK